MATVGNNCIISDTAVIEENVILGHNCVVEDGAKIGANSVIEHGTIIRTNSVVGADSYIGANCIIGEYTRAGHEYNASMHSLKIGDKAIIRSGAIIYTDSIIGNDFQTGHNVTIREKSCIGNSVSVGTLSDIQGDCTIGNYVRMHSNVHIGKLSVVDDFVWIYPYVVLTNDPTPPSNNMVGVHVCSFAIIATGSIVMPGITLGNDCLIGAGSVVTKDVDSYKVAFGNPAKMNLDVREVRHKLTGEKAYPWRYHMERHMPWEDIGYDAWYASLDLGEE